ncbi:MAG TPA: hypothetical protein VFN92_13460 [Solirubrobacterales bacterium]|nr:hypothetical protein [Solirubrobacterales bacterium]
MGNTLQFKKRFKPLTVEISDKADAVHFYETVPLTRSKEQKIRETQESIRHFDAATTDEEALDVVLQTIDEMIVSKPGKKTPAASKVLKDLWKGEEIEGADIGDFFNDLFQQRRPT